MWGGGASLFTCGCGHCLGLKEQAAGRLPGFSCAAHPLVALPAPLTSVVAMLCRAVLRQGGGA